MGGRGDPLDGRSDKKSKVGGPPTLLSFSKVFETTGWHSDDFSGIVLIIFHDNKIISERFA